MSDDRLAGKVQDAMTILHWELRDLFINTLAYGSAGTEAQVAEHLRTGNTLNAAQAAVIIATLNDALISIDSTFRV